MKDKKRISTEQMRELTGATLRQLQWWHERRIIVPAHGLFMGSRAYSEAQIKTVSRLVRLRKMKVPLRWARKCVAMEWSSIRVFNTPMVVNGVLYVPQPMQDNSTACPVDYASRRGGSFVAMDKQAMSDPMIACGRTEA